jgi:hypothetical protein
MSACRPASLAVSVVGSDRGAPSAGARAAAGAPAGCRCRSRGAGEGRQIRHLRTFAKLGRAGYVVERHSITSLAAPRSARPRDKSHRFVTGPMGEIANPRASNEPVWSASTTDHLRATKPAAANSQQTPSLTSPAKTPRLTVAQSDDSAAASARCRAALTAKVFILYLFWVLGSLLSRKRCHCLR